MTLRQLKYMLPQNHCSDNWEGTLFSLLHIYFAHFASAGFDHSVRRVLNDNFTFLFFKILQENKSLRKSYYFIDKFTPLLNKKT